MSLNHNSTIEIFDIEKAKLIIKYTELFKTRLNEYTPEYDPFKMLSNYIACGKNGKVKVNYKQINNRGRYFASNSIGLQSLCREIRGSIAGSFYYDIDMVNCHPMIYRQMCINNGLETLYITDYCFNRDKIINNIISTNPGFDVSRVKSGLLSILNMGEKIYRNSIKTDWLTNFYNETRKNINIIVTRGENVDLYEEMSKKKDFNIVGSVINHLFCHAENELFQIMLEYFKSKKIVKKTNNYVNCFDGIMIERGNLTGDKLNTHMRAIEALFETAGYAIKLKSKEFSELDMSIPEGYILPVIENDSIEPIALNKFDYKNPYTYQKFYNQFKNHQFVDENDMLSTLNPIYPSVISKLLKGEGIYIKKTVDNIDVVKKLGMSDFNVSYNKNDKIVKCKFSEVMKECYAFQNIVCKVNNERVSEEDFNTWQGYKANRVNLDNISNETKEGLEMMISFIRDVWACGNEEYFKWQVSWFKGLVGNSNDINGVGLVQIAKQGSGKGTIVEFISNFVLGDKLVFNGNGIAQIVQKHNSILQNKKLVIVNEMASTKDEFLSNFDKIKPFITDPTITIEPKGIDPYQIDNLGNYLFFSNNRDSMVIPNDSRRYGLFNMSDKYVGDFQYFIDLRAKAFNQEVGDAFYSWLLDFNSVNIRHIPKTDIMLELQEISKPNTIKFIESYIEEFKYNNDQLVNEGEEPIDFKIKSSDLYRKYTEWCNVNGERNKVSSTKFSLNLNSFDRIKKIKISCVYYILNDE